MERAIVLLVAGAMLGEEHTHEESGKGSASAKKGKSMLPAATVASRHKCC
jgi:hypothetical protein